jgi:choline transporter-like protein 2/4/5
MDGPLGNRRCTDFLFFLIFIAFVGAMGYISKYALANGKPEELLSPVDYDGKLCGVGDYSDYKHLYFLVTVKAVFEPQDSNSLFDLAFSPVCIDQCPVDATSKISCKGTSKINE